MDPRCKPLIDMEIEDVMAPMTPAMSNIASDTVPSGSVSLALQD